MCVTNTTSGRRPQPVTFHPALLNAFVPPKAAPVPAAPVFYEAEQQEQQLPVVCAAAPTEKPRPKRRRKPQKPGKTAKNQERHFVIHNYHDHANDEDVDDMYSIDSGERRRGGVGTPFPVKLHSVLDQVEKDGLAHIVSWSPHGRCFVIHNPKEFVDHVMPKYFRQTKVSCVF